MQLQFKRDKILDTDSMVLLLDAKPLPSFGLHFQLNTKQIGFVS